MTSCWSGPQSPRPTSARGELTQAPRALGRSLTPFVRSSAPVILATLWRLHGRIAFGPRRAIPRDCAPGPRPEAGRNRSRLTRHRPRPLRASASATSRSATSASSASTSRKPPPPCMPPATARHLALVHSMSGVMLAQAGRYDESMTALRHAERLATALGADDVLATVCGNQANVELFRHRYDQALLLAERAGQPARSRGPDAGAGRRAGHAGPDRRPHGRAAARRRRAPSRPGRPPARCSSTRRTVAPYHAGADVADARRR